jgi:hypothetical protein
VATSAESGGGPIGWAVRPDDLGEVAARLGLEIGTGSRRTPSGDHIEWRMAGTHEAMRRPWLPFFVEWADPARFPGAAATPVGAIARLELEGDLDELAVWLGDHALPLALSAGTTGVTSVVLDGPRGRTTI